MRIKQISTRIFFGLFVCGLLATLTAKADGMLVAPSNNNVYETDQKAVILYEDGIEDLFVSINFNGTAEDFGWIIPTPKEPEVAKSTDMLFERLDEMTRLEEMNSTRVPTNALGDGNMWEVGNGVEVLQTKKIDYYDISVLKAENKDALYNWLNDNGYSFPQVGKYIIEEYINNNWTFTAIKIDKEQIGNAVVQSRFRTGHAIPLRLTFETDKPVFPLKISSIGGMEDNAPAGEISFVGGGEENGVLIDSNKIIASDEVIDDFNPDNGSVSFQLKKRTNSSLGEIIRVEQAKAYLGQHQGFNIRNARNNIYAFEIWRNGGQHQTAEVDLGSDFRQNEWQKFEFSWNKNEIDSKKVDIKFFIDGAERTLNVSGYGLNSLRENEINEKSKLIIGGQEQYSDANGEISTYRIQRDKTSEVIEYVPPTPSLDYRAVRNADILIDEIRLNANDKTIFEAKFNNSLDINLLDGKSDILRVFSNQNTVYNKGGINKPTSMGVLIYVFAENKYEIPGFDLQYAGQISKDGIENIAKVDGKTPWINPKKEKYFLTRMYKQMEIAQMNEDIYPEESKNQEQYNSTAGEGNRMIFLVILLVVSFVSVSIMAFVLFRTERNKDENREIKINKKDINSLKIK
jgi:hypothetical protein